MTADPAIRTVAPPHTLQPLNPEQFQHHNQKHPDFTLVGIYSPATLLQVARRCLIDREKNFTLREFAGHLPTSPVNSQIHTSSVTHYVGLHSHSLLSWLDSAKKIICTIGHLVCIFVGLQHHPHLLAQCCLFPPWPCSEMARNAR